MISPVPVVSISTVVASTATATATTTTAAAAAAAATIPVMVAAPTVVSRIAATRWQTAGVGHKRHLPIVRGVGAGKNGAKGVFFCLVFCVAT